MREERRENNNMIIRVCIYIWIVVDKDTAPPYMKKDYQSSPIKRKKRKHL